MRTDDLYNSTVRDPCALNCAYDKIYVKAIQAVTIYVYVSVSVELRLAVRNTADFITNAINNLAFAYFTKSDYDN